jgi:signal transduction histidine kinase
MEDMGHQIWISVSLDMTRQAVAISVKDDGPGIPHDMMEKICEPFFSTHGDEGLRGLGLAIVKDIMKVHSGDIEIKSRPGEGTEIALYFPIYRPAATQEGSAV